MGGEGATPPRVLEVEEWEEVEWETEESVPPRFLREVMP